VHDCTLSSSVVTFASASCVGPSLGPKFGSKSASTYGRYTQATSSISFKVFKTFVALPYPRQISSKPTYARALLSLQVQQHLIGALSLGVPCMSGCAKSLNYRNLPSKGSAAILMYCFSLGLCKKNYSAAGSIAPWRFSAGTCTGGRQRSWRWRRPGLARHRTKWPCDQVGPPGPPPAHPSCPLDPRGAGWGKISALLAA
jgi:hypothetical protein